MTSPNEKPKKKHGGAREGAGAPQRGKKHRVTVSLDIDAYDRLITEATRGGMSISATAEAIIKEGCPLPKIRDRLTVKFKISPQGIEVQHDPHGLIETAVCVYQESRTQGFKVSETKVGSSTTVTLEALSKTWAAAVRPTPPNKKEDK